MYCMVYYIPIDIKFNILIFIILYEEELLCMVYILNVNELFTS